MFFYNRKKKSSRLVAPPDFSRSISVPADRLERLGKCDKTNNNHIVAATPMMSQSDRYYKIFTFVTFCVSIFVIRGTLAFYYVVLLFDLFYLYQAVLPISFFMSLSNCQISIETLGNAICETRLLS